MPIPSCCRFWSSPLPLAWPIDAMARTPSQSMVRDGINHTPKDKQKQAMRLVEKLWRLLAASAAGSRQTQSTRRSRRKAQQDAARRKALEDARRKAAAGRCQTKRKKKLAVRHSKTPPDAKLKKKLAAKHSKTPPDAKLKKKPARRKAQQDAARRKAQEEVAKAQQDAARRKVQEQDRREVQQDAAIRKAKKNPSYENRFKNQWTSAGPIQTTTFRSSPNQQPTGQSSSLSNKSNAAVQRPSHGAEWNPTSVKPSRKSKADLGPKPPPIPTMPRGS